MKEIMFLTQSAEKWKMLEGIVSGRDRAGPDRMAELYIQLTDDLSYARTFFAGSKTHQYLNSLAAKYHQAIYRNKKEERKRIFSFWREEQPLLAIRYRKQLLCSAAIFIVSLLVGVVSSAYDEGFVRLILGSGYVKMTLENIEKGDPLAVYKSLNSVDLFLGVTINNIRVAAAAFALGALASVGTVYILFYNGIMLGAFHYFFYKKGLLLKSILSIWIHGTLEISAVLVSGCAGFVMGAGILFPGTYTRGRSFAHGAREGLKILIGVIPLFIVAGFFEGFLTRHTEMPAIVNVSIIGLSALFVIWYYFIYPAKYYSIINRG